MYDNNWFIYALPLSERLKLLLVLFTYILCEHANISIE